MANQMDHINKLMFSVTDFNALDDVDSVCVHTYIHSIGYKLK